MLSNPLLCGQEGGVRTPTFISGGFGPAVAPGMAGKSLSGIVHICDWMPTFLHAVGIEDAHEPQAPVGLDGIVQWEYLMGRSTTAPRTEVVLDHRMFGADDPEANPSPGHPGRCSGCHVRENSTLSQGAMRVGDWKLIVGIEPHALHYGWFSPNASRAPRYVSIDNVSGQEPKSCASCPPGTRECQSEAECFGGPGSFACSIEKPCLFDLGTDMGEHHNLAEKMPGKVAELVKRFREFDQSFHPPLSPMPTGPDTCRVDADEMTWDMPCPAKSDDDDARKTEDSTRLKQDDTPDGGRRAAINALVAAETELREAQAKVQRLRAAVHGGQQPAEETEAPDRSGASLADSSLNLVQNPDFEQLDAGGYPAGWSSCTVFRQSTSVFLPPASASLEYSNEDPNTFQVPTQRIPSAVPGSSYHVSAQIKTVGLDNSAAGGGATILVEWDKGGHWKGEYSPAGIAGTTNWTTISKTFTLPKDADPGMTVGVYVVPNASGHRNVPVGKAFFGNVTVVLAAAHNSRPAYPWPGHGAAVLSNPLRGLPALPKPHHSWGIDALYFTNESFADGVLHDYVRITHSAPIQYGCDNPLGPTSRCGSCGDNASCVIGAVIACARATAANNGTIEAKLAINWSPWTHEFQGGADPTSTAGEQADLDAYSSYLTRLKRSIAAANVKAGTAVQVGVVMLDSERFNWATGSTPEYIAALTRKNELVYNATRRMFPSLDVKIVFYDRGAVHSYPEMNTTECIPELSPGRPVASNLPPGFCVAAGFSYRERFDKGDPFATSLYALPVNTTACNKHLCSLGCVSHPDGAVSRSSS